ncbi:uncharacterized protein N7484_002871 [Penicillium longicatenatum]|uniref:uncharacterized protein n=1 Tax=Penicillium longicatenatum TaxID=1561947 RepID=UPI002548ABD1|nr:uncharacterized protein N7484_002871 [Penicillium longicatenatum]KAJ5649148.1 hypothetical protein N7484_002871 [Penicillium longicatenatum]
MDFNSNSQHLYTLEDVANHNKDGDLWVIINGKVFDMTTYMDTHPGGKQVLLKHGGLDATKKYLKYHKPQTMAREGDALCIGVVKKTGSWRKLMWKKAMSGLFDHS